MSNKFNVGDDVIYYKEDRGIIRAISTYEFEGIEEWEYAVEFYYPDTMENLYGCTSKRKFDLVPEGKGKWIAEEHLEAIKR